MFKKCKIVLIPANGNAQIEFDNSDKQLWSVCNNENKKNDEHSQRYHLAISSFDGEVIASTDSSARMPNIPPSFINYVVSEYNNQHNMDEVAVEYEIIYNPELKNIRDSKGRLMLYKPHVNRDRDIAVKCSWTTNEMETIALESFYKGYHDCREGKPYIQSEGFEGWLFAHI